MGSRLKIVLAYAVLATLWIFGSDRLLSELIRDPVVLGWIGTVKGMAFVAVTSLLLYLILRVRDGRALARSEPAAPMRVRHLLGLFLGLSLVVPLLGYGIYQLYSPQVRQDAFSDLSAIATLKTDQIESWLAQRQDTAAVLAKDADMAGYAVQLLTNERDEAVRVRIRARLDAVRQVYGYDAILLDASGRTVLAVNPHPELSEQIKRHLLPLALRTGQVQRSELYRDASGGIHLDYVVPLQPQRAGEERAALVLHTPVEHFLFPLIQRWPTPSASAETMLVRREGDQVLYLNELRSQHNTALSLRVPLASENSPSAMAVRAGRARHMETLDRRGVHVLAASRPVAGTAWYVVAKIDRAEVLAPLKRLALWVSIVTLAGVFVVAGALLLLWRQQQRALHLELIAQGADRDRLLKLFFDLPFVGMSITSPVTKRWTHVNDRLCDMLGYTREEMMGLTWAELTHAEDLATDVAEFERVLRGEGEGYQMDKRFLRKDGSCLYATIDVKVVRQANGEVALFVATIQDITARRRMEIMQHGNALILASLVKNEALSAVLTHLTDLIGSVLPGAIGSVLLLDDDGKHLRLGEVSGLPEVLNQAVDGVAIGEGVGSCGTAAFRGERVVVEDITLDPLWENYRYLVAEANLRACWSEPILSSDASVLGTFAVYFTEPRSLVADDDKLLRTAANLAALAIQIKRTQHALLESEARFRAIIDTEPECVKMIGPDGKLAFMNRAGLAMIEAESLEQVQGHSVLEIVTPDYQQAFRRLTKKVLKGERGILEFEIVGLKGARRFLETHAVALRASETEPFSLLGITRDITERKKMEDQLRRQLAELLRWQEVMLGREDRVQQLKGQVNELLVALDQPCRYPSQGNL